MQIEFNNKTYKVKQWSNEYLGNLTVVDTETTLIKNPTDIPDLIVTTAYGGGE